MRREIMKVSIPLCVLALALSIPLGAQDSTTKSRTKVKADEGRVVAMTGCLRQDPLTSSYLLAGTMSATGNELKSDSKVKTDIDRHDAKVKSKTQTSVDDRAVATSGAVRTFALMPASDVNLSSYIGQQVQLSA